MLYNIYAGLSGGFGGAKFIDTLDFVSKDEAYTYAYGLACEEYDSMAGLHGLRTYEDIANEEGYDLEDENDGEEVDQIYDKERDSWIDYYVKEYIKK